MCVYFSASFEPRIGEEGRALFVRPKDSSSGEVFTTACCEGRYIMPVGNDRHTKGARRAVLANSDHGRIRLADSRLAQCKTRVTL